MNESTYETIFLLYIDKELSPEERLEVETFIAQNPSYADLMNALKATVVTSEKISYPFKEALKQETLVESLEPEEVWDQAYSNYLKEDMQSIPGLSNRFKDGLKKESASRAILLKGFGLNQNKFTYTAVAALLMVFFGYQQLIKIPASYTLTANTKTKKIVAIVPLVNNTEELSGMASNKSNSNILEVRQKSDAKRQLVLAQVSKINPVAQYNKVIQPRVINEIIVTAAEEPIETYPIQNSTNITEDKIAITLSNNSMSNKEDDTELMPDEKLPISYEIIDTEDPNRAIYIANFEIDGNRLRGLKRKVSSLFKNNKNRYNK